MLRLATAAKRLYPNTRQRQLSCRQVRTFTSNASSSLLLLSPSRAELSATDLLRSGDVFHDHTPLLDGFMHHFTSVDNRALIERCGYVRGGFAHSKYDGRLKFPDAPERCFFTLQAQSDATFFPFSAYPAAASVAEGAETACLSVDVRGALFSGAYAAFHSGSNLSTPGGGFARTCRTQLVFAAGEHLEFARRHLTPVSLSDNGILFIDAEGVPQVATTMSPRVFRSQDMSPRPVKHSVDVVVLGNMRLPKTDSALSDGTALEGTMSDCAMSDGTMLDCTLSDGTASEGTMSDGTMSGGTATPAVRHLWRDAHRLRMLDSDADRRVTRVECPVCLTGHRSVANLKVHYRALHSDHREAAFECPVAACGFASRWHRSVLAHVAAKHPPAPLAAAEQKRRSASYECAQCGFSTTTRLRLEKHTRFEHNGGLLECPHLGCSYKSKWKSAMRVHLNSMKHTRDGHLGPCSQCGHRAPSMAALVQHARLAHGERLRKRQLA